jgi:DNA-binding transcriptional MerR regulator
LHLNKSNGSEGYSAVFKIGAFSKITGISVHQLRHYDRLGLLHPAHTDDQSGYRYYTVEQLARLNRLLALKDLGFSLEQIGGLLNEAVSADEIRGMLRLKRAQLEQNIADEQARLRRVESRLRQIDDEGSIPNYHVVLKEIPAQYFIGTTLSPWHDMQVRDLFEDLYDTLIAQRVTGFDHAIVVLDEWDSAAIHLGYLIDEPLHRQICLANRYPIQTHQLPPVELAATIIHDFPRADGHISYGRLVDWVDKNGYDYMHPHREIYLRSSYHTNDDGNMAEFQLPVRISA